MLAHAGAIYQWALRLSTLVPSSLRWNEPDRSTAGRGEVDAVAEGK